MRTITHIVVHTAAAANAQGQPVYQTAQTIHDYHVKHNGWRKGGYHAVIQRDGYTCRNPALTRTEDEVGAHVSGFNDKTLGVCVAGHGDFADFLPEQVDALVELCVEWCERYGLDASRVIGHREAPVNVDKTCPGTKVNMHTLRAYVQTALVARKLQQPPPATLTLEERVARLEAAVHELKPGWMP